MVVVLMGEVFLNKALAHMFKYHLFAMWVTQLLLYLLCQGITDFLTHLQSNIGEFK